MKVSPELHGGFVKVSMELRQDLPRAPWRLMETSVEPPWSVVLDNVGHRKYSWYKSILLHLSL